MVGSIFSARVEFREQKQRRGLDFERRSHPCSFQVSKSRPRTVPVKKWPGAAKSQIGLG
jgi:hypothetical protein